MLFGTYPAAEQWRGWLLSAIIAGLALASARRSWWRPGLAVAWVVGIAAALTLQLGGVGGLARVPTANWGGLPLTLLLFLGTVTVGLPLATVLALARRSSYPVIRMLAIGYIEVVRGVPLVNILFVASLMFPLFMPPGVDIDKLLRAQVGMILFFAAYTAETLRGGLQAIPRGQYEAADALGLGYWRRTRAIVLPQAFRVALPALLNDLIRAFKNTSVLVVIGLLDVLGGTMAALEDPFWTRHYVEAYLCVASLYLVICFALARQSQRLERELARGRDG
jgi:general L-amino acid transport system permease protein